MRYGHGAPRVAILLAVWIIAVSLPRCGDDTPAPGSIVMPKDLANKDKPRASVPVPKKGNRLQVRRP
jgi:hypothetical protein